MEYSIEGESVSEETYDIFIATLKEVEGTYHCAKTIGGGRNSYEAKDSSGTKWICKSVSVDGKTTRSVEKK